MNNKQYNILLAVIVSLVALFLLIKLLYDINNVRNLNKNVKFPPWPSKCPDYWKVISPDEDNLVCQNVHRIGDCKNADINTNDIEDQTMNFSEAPFTGQNGEYFKCMWAKKCRAPWEGVDNLC
tara:strand:- start:224 stop:592 length:369 start_codon:yes stop_codon:yes gene_type:complete